MPVPLLEVLDPSIRVGRPVQLVAEDVDDPDRASMTREASSVAEILRLS